MTQEMNLTFLYQGHPPFAVDSLITAFEVKFIARRHEDGRWELINAKLVAVMITLEYRLPFSQPADRTEGIRLPIDLGWLTEDARKYIRDWIEHHFWEQARMQFQIKHDERDVKLMAPEGGARHASV